MQRIFLVPGFFGFANVAGIRYFRHVRLALEARLPDDAWSVHAIQTRPTGSLRARARALHDAVLAGSDTGDQVHLIGHSTGGIDARLVTTPGVRLGDDVDPEAVASRVRSVVSISSPHRGSPLAVAFGTLAGKRLLQLMSLVTVTTLRGGRVPLAALRHIRDLLMGDEESTAEAVARVEEELLGTLAAEPRQAVDAFLAEVWEDRSLPTQLTPDAMDVVDATTPDRAGVRYGCVCTVAIPPGLQTTLDAGLSPMVQAAHAVYAACYSLAGPLPAGRADPLPAAASLRLDAARGAPLRSFDNDGFVPTRSQVHGELVSVARADHLDVIGHFHGPQHEPAHNDWFPSGCRFRREGFDRVWDEVSAFLEGAAGWGATPRGRSLLQAIPGASSGSRRR